jgi:hypothetical protein
MKKNTLIFLALFLGFGSVWAEELALWTKFLPDYRVVASTDELPEHLFGVKVRSVDVNYSKDGAASSRTQTAIAKIKSLPITGLVWSADSHGRRVLMGDIVLREGQAIPNYVFNDGWFYTLTSISQNTLSFSMQEGPFGTPESFDVSFGLTEPVQNTSTYSNGEKKK